MKRPSIFVLSILALIFAAANGAFMGVIARFLHTDFSILQQVYLYTGVAFVLSLFIFHRSIRWKKLLHLPSREWGIVSLRGIATTVIGAGLFAYAVQLTDLGDAAFIGALPTTAVLGFILLRERVTWWKLVLILTATTGAVLVAVQDFSHVLTWNKGDLLIILSDLGFGLGYVARKWHGHNVLNNKEITSLCLLTGTVGALILSILLGGSSLNLHIDATAVFAVLLAGLLIVANGLFINYAFKHISAVQGGNLLTLETVFGVLFGFLFYQEVPEWKAVVGGLVIAASVVAMNVYSGREVAVPSEQAKFGAVK